MKKLAALGVMIALMSLLLVGAPAAVANPGNLLANPGFGSGDATGWTVGGTVTRGVATDGATSPSDGTLGSSNQVRTGTYSFLNITSTGPMVGTTLTQTVTVTPNTTYNLGFFSVRATGNVGRTFSATVNGNAVTLTHSNHIGWGTHPVDFRRTGGTYVTGPAET